MPTILRDPSFDTALDLLREGYPFLLNRSERLDSDLFQIRLLGMPVICLHGAEAAELFYDPRRFVRLGAVPRRIQTTLMGQDAVQTLDGTDHRCRKDMFMRVMTPESRLHLMTLLSREWETYARRWEQTGGQVVLFPEVQEILCRAACAWCQVPLREKEVRRRAADFGAMVDAFGAVGARHSEGKRARERAEKWIRNVIRHVRRGKLRVADDSPTAIIAFHREPDGKLLSDQMAAVELINLLRPIVAIATYVTFAAVALHEHPRYRELLQDPRQGDYAELFTQEVRRHSPFAPFLGARVKEDFTWHGYEFPKGRLVLLDVFGTNRDPRTWREPDTFWPDRFRDWDGSRFNFIPQGGGSYETGHRCAGEWVTIEALKQAVTFLAARLRYEVPPQDLGYDLSRLPTLPRSGFVLEQVERVGEPPQPAIRNEAPAGCPFHVAV